MELTCKGNETVKKVEEKKNHIKIVLRQNEWLEQWLIIWLMIDFTIYLI